MAEEKVTKTKVKRKSWIQIVAPKFFNNEVIGEIPVTETDSLIGRIVTVSLMNLTRDIKKQSTNLKFRITNVQGGKANTESYGYCIVPASIRRIVRRGKKKIIISFICKTSDKKNIRLKALMVPYVNIKSSVSNSLQKAAITYLINHIAKTTFENAIKESINNRIKNALKDEIKKIYPIRMVEIAALQIEKEEKQGESKEEIQIEDKKAEEKKETPKEEKTEKKENKEEKPKEEEKKEEEKEAPKSE